MHVILTFAKLAMHDMPCGMTVGDEVLRDEPLAVFPPTACWSGEDDEAIVERLAPDERKAERISSTPSRLIPPSLLLSSPVVWLLCQSAEVL